MSLPCISTARRRNVSALTGSPALRYAAPRVRASGASSFARSASADSSSSGALAIRGRLRVVVVVGCFLRERAELGHRGHHRRQIEIAGELGAVGPRGDRIVVAAASVVDVAQQELHVCALQRRQRRLACGELLLDRERLVDLALLDVELARDELRDRAIGRLRERFRDEIGRDIGLAVSDLDLREADERVDVGLRQRERLLIPIASDVEPAAVTRGIAGERPRLHDRARIAAADVFAREDREQIGLALRRLRGRQRRGEPDLRADVILLELEHRREVRLRAVEIEHLDLRAAARVERRQLDRRIGGDRGVERLHRTGRIALRGERPAEVQLPESVLGIALHHRLQLGHGAIGLVRSDHAERLRGIELRPGDAGIEGIGEHFAAVRDLGVAADAGIDRCRRAAPRLEGRAPRRCARRATAPRWPRSQPCSSVRVCRRGSPCAPPRDVLGSVRCALRPRDDVDRRTRRPLPPQRHRATR